MAVIGGLFNYLTQSSACAALQALLPGLSPIDGVPQYPVYKTRAPKQPPASFLVIHVVDVPPAAHSMDGPSSLKNGEFQFDSFGPDEETARLLSQTVLSVLEDFVGTLNDGTVIQFYEVSLDADDGYELGAQGYVFRAVLRLRAFYTETGTLGPTPGGTVTYYAMTPNNTTTVTATVVVSANAIMVRNGSVLTQGAGADYTASGTTVTFAVAPKVGDNLGFWQ